MTRDDVLAAIASAIGTVLELDPASVTPAQTFVDLKADSLALVEIVDIVEAQLADRGFAFDDEDLDDLRTVGDAVDYALARLA